MSNGEPKHNSSKSVARTFAHLRRAMLLHPFQILAPLFRTAIGTTMLCFIEQNSYRYRTFCSRSTNNAVQSAEFYIVLFKAAGKLGKWNPHLPPVVFKFVSNLFFANFCPSTLTSIFKVPYFLREIFAKW